MSEHEPGLLGVVPVEAVVAAAVVRQQLADEPAFEYETPKEEFVEQAALFCLRGMGLTDSAVERYFRPRKLRKMFERSFK